MITAFGKFTKKLRIDKGELLKDMAEKLGVTASYLSAVENGKRNVPKNWIEKLTTIYSLSSTEKKDLEEAVNSSQITNFINVKGLKREDQDIVMALARKIGEMDEKQKAHLKSFLQH